MGSSSRRSCINESVRWEVDWLQAAKGMCGKRVRTLRVKVGGRQPNSESWRADGRTLGDVTRVRTVSSPYGLSLQEPEAKTLPSLSCASRTAWILLQYSSRFSGGWILPSE